MLLLEFKFRNLRTYYLQPYSCKKIIRVSPKRERIISPTGDKL